MFPVLTQPFHLVSEILTHIPRYRLDRELLDWKTALPLPIADWWRESSSDQSSTVSDPLQLASSTEADEGRKNFGVPTAATDEAVIIKYKKII